MRYIPCHFDFHPLPDDEIHGHLTPDTGFCAPRAVFSVGCISIFCDASFLRRLAEEAALLAEQIEAGK